MKQRFLISLFLIVILLFTSCGRYQATNPTDIPMSSAEQTEIVSTESPNSTPDTNGKPPFEDTAIISADGETITVHNANELLYYLESNKHFLLMSGDYDIYKTQFIEGYDYTFKDLNNITLEGVGEEQIDFITNDIDRDVLSAENCKGITLINLYLGHVPRVETKCSGSVLFINNCQGFTIKNCTLFGCGEYGIMGFDNSNLIAKDSTILDCAEDLVYLSNSKRILFNNCYFYNRENERLSFNDCQTVEFNDCELIGELRSYPPIYANRESVLQYPSNGKTYRINERVYEWGTLTNVNIGGYTAQGEITDRLNDIKQGVSVQLHRQDDEFSEYERSYLYCSLMYNKPLLEAEYLKTINEAISVIKEYFQEEIILSIDWPEGTSSELQKSSEGVWINCPYSSLENIFQDGRKYLTADEAKDIFLEWLLSEFNDTYMTKPLNEEDIEIYLISTKIVATDVFYLLDVYDGDNSIDQRYVNAIDGSISK